MIDKNIYNFRGFRSLQIKSLDHAVHYAVYHTIRKSQENPRSFNPVNTKFKSLSMTSFQKKLFFFQSETPVELQLQPAKICFNNLYSMGSEFSRGSITPIVQKWMPLKWDELLSLYKKYRSFNVHETHYGCFLSFSIFYSLFHASSSCCTEFELRIVFQLLDPSSKGIISSIDLFAGLALLLSTSLEPKFKCTYV